MGNVRWWMASWAMVCALLPSILSLGHWGVSFEVPGYGGRVVLVPAGEHGPDGHGGDEGADDSHERHCHGDAASCSDVPFAGGSAFAILKEFTSGFATEAPGAVASVAVTALMALYSPSPETRPPRAAGRTRDVFGPQVGGLL